MPQIWADSLETHRRQVRLRIVEATRARVAERGLAATSMSHVAERVGIGRATLYNYFPDVEHILLAWHDEEVDRYRSSLAAELDAQDDALSGVRIFVNRLLRGFADDHDQALDAAHIALSALSPEVKHQMGSATAKLADVLAQVLQRGVRERQLRADLDIPLTSTLIMRMTTAARDTAHANGQDPQELADATLALLLGGIAIAPDRPPATKKSPKRSRS